MENGHCFWMYGPQYKYICRLEDPAAIQNKLRVICALETSRSLFELAVLKRLNFGTEAYVLCEIRLVAVRRLHKEAHRQKFHFMKTEQGWIIEVMRPSQILWILNSMSEQTNLDWEIPNTKGEYWWRQLCLLHWSRNFMVGLPGGNRQVNSPL